MNFSEIERKAKPILEKIMILPFNVELANGTLPMEKFIFYLQQDALYLSEFSKALTLTAIKLPKNHMTQQFLNFSLEALNAEKALHNDFIHRYKQYAHQDVDQSPSCFMYTNYLLQMASIKSVEEAVASLMPCFWVYREVALYIAKQSQSYTQNPYQDWIKLYSSDEFSTSTALAITIFNELIHQLNQHQLDNVVHAFMRSTKLEWHFWDSAYNMESWLV